MAPTCVDGWLCQTHNFDGRQTDRRPDAGRLSGPSRSLLSAPDIDLLEPRDGAAVAFPKKYSRKLRLLYYYAITYVLYYRLQTTGTHLSKALSAKNLEFK